MMIDDLLKSPLLKRALTAGEERMGRLVSQILSNERLMLGIQTVVSSAKTAKTSFDRGMKTAMQAVSLPTTEDVEELRHRLGEVETLLDTLATRVGRGPKGQDSSNGRSA
ncbi:MAG TPA: hypothetical protein VMK12_13910 [Anaeromyxobacteraceae bacterium]|nr:hypothetical protein [Anaeromyxobacteraceae bacterium]